MGLFHGIMGDASETDIDKVKKKYDQIFAFNEDVVKAYKIIRDLFIFTDKRLILVDKQGITGKKIEYHSIPYKNITHFSVETVGHFDLEAELKIWIAGTQMPIEKTFNSSLNIYDVQKTLAQFVLR